jgi:uncharacterized protein (TIGR01777 family)
MRIFLTGATGFIGRALTLRLLREGHQVVAYARDAAKARANLGGEVEIAEASAGLEQGISGCDAIINLGGEPIFVGRWTPARKALLKESRVSLTRGLVDAIGKSSTRPKVLISTSAVGYYGDRKDERLDESAGPGSDFLADICNAWEVEAQKAVAHGTRVAIVRIGLVMGPEGGALQKMLPPFQMGVGGRLGSGRQYMPWIHLEDLVEIFAQAVTDPRFQGPINGTAPKPVTNLEFTKALGHALGRPTIFPVPSPALHLVLGEAAGALLGGQNAVPAKLLGWGFSFKHPELGPALEGIVRPRGVEIGPAQNPPDVEYLRRRGAKKMLSATTEIDAPIAEVFEFFNKAENLGAMTPPALAFDIQTKLPIPMGTGTVIDYVIRLGPVPMKWRTLIEGFEPGVKFVDSQQQGPYRSWWHEHHFRAFDGGTLMEDRVYFSAPFGPIGRIAEQLFIAPMLQRIFSYRATAIRLRFGTTQRHDQRRAA